MTRAPAASLPQGRPAAFAYLKIHPLGLINRIYGHLNEICFLPLAPLVGSHRRLVREKRKILGETGQRLEAGGSGN